MTRQLLGSLLVAATLGGCAITSRGFGDDGVLAQHEGDGGTIVRVGNKFCVLPPAQAVLTQDKTSQGGAGVKYRGLEVEGSGSSSKKEGVEILYEQEFNILYTQRLLHSVCEAQINGTLTSEDTIALMRSAWTAIENGLVLDLRGDAVAAELRSIEVSERLVVEAQHLVTAREKTVTALTARAAQVTKKLDAAREAEAKAKAAQADASKSVVVLTTQVTQAAAEVSRLEARISQLGDKQLALNVELAEATDATKKAAINARIDVVKDDINKANAELAKLKLVDPKLAVAKDAADKANAELAARSAEVRALQVSLDDLAVRLVAAESALARAMEVQTEAVGSATGRGKATPPTPMPQLSPITPNIQSQQAGAS